MQGGAKPAFRGDESREALQPLGERFDRLVVRREEWSGVGTGVDFAAEDGGDEVRALREAPVESARADSRLAVICGTGASTPDVANTSAAAVSRASMFRCASARTGRPGRPPSAWPPFTVRSLANRNNAPYAVVER
jgi:hypothetical protein